MKEEKSDKEHPLALTSLSGKALQSLWQMQGYDEQLRCG